MTQDLSNNSPILLNDPKFYPEKLLAKRMRAVFITIPQTTIDYFKLHAAFTEYEQVAYVITAEEHHKDEGLHIHLVIKLKQQVKLSVIHKIIAKQEGNVRGTINYQAPKHILKSINYVKKDGKYHEDGDIPKEAGRQTDNTTLEAIKLAKEGQLEEAIEIIRETNPLDYLKHKETLIENLRTENITREKFPLPDLSQGITLRPYQEKVVELLRQTPKARRIIWVEGRPNAGKSFLINYLSNLQNYNYGVYHAGQSIKFDDLAYNYDEEGAIVWDFPKAYDWENLSNHAGQMIEKFSDYGQKISSKKYKGKTQHIRGHVLVCSNRPPIESILHRDIIHIKTDDEHHQEEEQTNTTINDIDTPPTSDSDLSEEEEFDDEDSGLKITKKVMQPQHLTADDRAKLRETRKRNKKYLSLAKSKPNTHLDKIEDNNDSDSSFDVDKHRITKDEIEQSRKKWENKDKKTSIKKVSI